MVGRIENLVSVNVMEVVLDCPAMVGCVRADCMHCEIPCVVVDRVRRPVDVAGTCCGCGSEVAGGRRSRRWRWGLGSRNSRGDRRGFSGVGLVEPLRVVEDLVAGLPGQEKWRMNRVESQVSTATAADAEAGDLIHIYNMQHQYSDRLPLENHIIGSAYLSKDHQIGSSRNKS